MSHPTAPPRPDSPVASNLLAIGGHGLVRLAQLHRQRQQTIAQRLRDRMRQVWRWVTAVDPVRSWARVAPQALIVVRAALVEAARGVDDYVAAALRMQGAATDPFGAVPPGTFGLTAADGRPLDSLLGYPAFEVSAFVDGGMSGDQALAIGARHLDRIVVTETADAARVSTGVAITNDRKTAGFIRYLTPPSCSRCVILAGQWYRYNAGFARHNLCDCIGIPAAEVIEPQSPKDIFDAMTDAELKKAGWSAADVAAIKDHGADIYQVTNAHRELHSVTVAGQQLQATRVAAKGRGQRGVRLTPASLYAESTRLGWSRDELLRQLKRYGYIA